jgi:hypothetical protein
MNQISNYRIYLAELLDELSIASNEIKLAIAERGVFIELANILKFTQEIDK